MKNTLYLFIFLFTLFSCKKEPVIISKKDMSKFYYESSGYYETLMGLTDDVYATVNDTEIVITAKFETNSSNSISEITFCLIPQAGQNTYDILLKDGDNDNFGFYIDNGVTKVSAIENNYTPIGGSITITINPSNNTISGTYTLDFLSGKINGVSYTSTDPRKASISFGHFSESYHNYSSKLIIKNGNTYTFYQYTPTSNGYNTVSLNIQLNSLDTGTFSFQNNSTYFPSGSNPYSVISGNYTVSKITLSNHLYTKVVFAGTYNDSYYGAYYYITDGEFYIN